jgi:hypothetical protein
MSTARCSIPGLLFDHADVPHSIATTNNSCSRLGVICFNFSRALRDGNIGPFSPRNAHVEIRSAPVKNEDV